MESHSHHKCRGASHGEDEHEMKPITTDPLESLAQASLSMPPIEGGTMEEDLAKTMLWRLHQALYQHLTGCGMKKTAESFLEESKFFPRFSSIDYSEILEGAITKAWSSYYYNRQSQVGPVQSPKAEEEDTRRGKGAKMGDRSFVCDFADCGKSFARKYDLKVHTRTHTKEKPYVCSYVDCGKRFGRISSVREHERNVHGGVHAKKKQKVSFECQDCKRDFHDEEELETHQRFYHGSKCTHNHNHKPGCGHIAVVHDGHADFLIPDSSGVARLHHYHRGVLEPHTLKASSSNPVTCSPSPSTKHERNHTHGPGCGHEAILHENHIDYLVDNILHHHHGDHCDLHGNLTILPTFDDTLDELLNCTWDNCTTLASGKGIEDGSRE